MAAPNAYHYIAVFPRLYERPRPAWPEDLIARVRAVAGVVDAIFPDLTASWLPAGVDTGRGQRVETRRRFVEVYTKSDTPAEARATRDELVALLDAVKAELGEAGYTLVTIPIDDVELR